MKKSEKVSKCFVQDCTLPIDVSTEENESEYPIHKGSFDAVFTIMISMKVNIYQTAGEIICLTQEKQRCDCNRCHQVPNKFQVGQKVPLKNQRRMNRKGGKRFSPFTVPSISIKILCSLINKDEAQIKFAETVLPYEAILGLESFV